MPNKDHLLREIAERYIEQYGEELKAELRELNEQNAYDVTPGLDRKVKAGIGVGKKRNVGRAIGLIAACALLLLVSPRILKQMNIADSTTAPTSGSATEVLAEESEAPQETSTGPVVVYEIIPLAFTPPQQFEQVDFLQDKEKSVYMFSDSNLDDVVVTLEASPEKPVDSTLVPLMIGNHEVYAVSESTYNLLTFDYEEVRYTLTCEYDLNTLVNFSESILI